jgi:predicted nucleotide-binding protein
MTFPHKVQKTTWGSGLPNIVLIDDDYAADLIVENLGYHGYSARRIGSFQAALDSIDEIIKADLIILDIIMERSESGKGISGDRSSGMAVLQAIRQRSTTIPVLVFSATNDPDLIASLHSAEQTAFRSKWNTPTLKELLTSIQKMIGTTSAKSKPKAFIVHGHDTAEKYALKNYLQNTLGFAEPIILHEQPNLGRTLIEKLENYSADTDFAFVLLTPDDEIFSGAGSNDQKRQARQNVIFEAGLFVGIYGRASGRVILLYKGALDLPSDLSGIVYIDITNGIEAAGEVLRRELAHVIN